MGNFFHAWPCTILQFLLLPQAMHLCPATCSFSCVVPQTFLCHESSHFELIPQSPVFFPCNPSVLSFYLPIPCLLCGDCTLFKNLNSFQDFTVLFCAHLLRLATVHQFRTHSLSRTARTFYALSPFIPCLPSQRSQSWPEPDTFFQFLILVLRCPLPPPGRSRLLHEHFLHVFWANVSRVHLYFPFKGSSVPLWPLCAQITCLTHDSSCRSSHLSPRLNLKYLLHPCFFLFCTPFVHPRSFFPGLSGRGGKLFFHI